MILMEISLVNNYVIYSEKLSEMVQCAELISKE